MKLTEEKLDSTLKYKGVVIDVYNDRVLLENGKEATRDVVRHPGGVCVVALNENNEVYFVRQFRYPHGKVLLEIPAGKLEWGEDHFACGKRELLEETGCTADEFTYLGCLLPTPAHVYGEGASQKQSAFRRGRIPRGKPYPSRQGG